MAAALSEQGRTWLGLGARVPAGALRETVEKVSPTVVLLWAHRADLAERVPPADLTARTGPVVAVAGRGWADLDLPGGAHRPGSLRDAVLPVLDAVPTEIR